MLKTSYSAAPVNVGVTVRRRRLPSRARSSLGGEIPWSLAALLLVALPLPYLLRFDASHMVTAAGIGLTLCAVSFYSRVGAVSAAMIFLAFLGDYRRYVGFFEGYPQSDLLLLVGPAAAAFLLGQALMYGRLALSTGLSKLIAALMLMMIIEIFNPQQGGLDVGFAGALFYIAPLLWFWVGRVYATREFLGHFSLRTLVGIGLLAALWGLYQSYRGLFAFEQLWVDQIGYGALYISDEVIRAIGFFNSSAEYQRFLIITAIVLLAAWLAERSRLVLLLPIVLVAVFLSAARGPVIMFAAAAVVVWAISARSLALWLPRLLGAAALGGAALVLLLTVLQTTSFSGRIAPLVSRQVEGLLDPANAEKSTATGHLEMIRNGVSYGFTSPAGRGLGATTLAASKYGEKTINAEVDFANLMLSLGLLGGLLYAAIVVVVLVKAVRWWMIERHTLALVTLGILVVTLGSWLIGGEYSAAALIWFVIGSMDRLSTEEQAQRHRSRRLAAGHHHA
jgi:hypothetical protein